MSALYTDDEVRAAVTAILQSKRDCSMADDVRTALDAVAPAIAARAKAEALREYADDLEANNSALSWQWSDFVEDAREYATSYRADEIERP